MIGFFPELYPDELLYSAFSRYYDMSGYCSDASAKADLFENPRLPIDPFLCNPLTKSEKQILLHERTTARILENHTMLPLYLRFAGKLVKQKISGSHEGIFIPGYDSKYRVLCYCSACAIEDRNRFGETYWHRCHQIPETPICERHYCRLIQYKVDRRHLISAEQAIGKSTISSIPVRNPQEIIIARYVKSVFMADLHLEDSASVKPFLTARLQQTPYASASGHINAEMLRRDIIKRFRIPSVETWEFKDVFDIENSDFFKTCLLGLFLKISPQELCYPGYMERPERIRLPRIETSKRGTKPIDWDAADEQFYPRVQAAIREIRSGARSKAQITKGTVERYLGLKPDTISNMPRCRALVEKEQEK